MIINAAKQVSSDVLKIEAEDGPVFFIRYCYLSEISPESIVSGAFFEENMEQELLDAALAFAAENSAASFLARCEQCRFLLEKKLLKKGHSKTAVKMSLDYLEESGLLSDYRFSLSWLTGHVISKPQGYNRLYMELLSRGIKPNTAKTALEEFFNNFDENELFLRALQKAKKENKSGEKLKKYLFDSGFSGRFLKQIDEDFTDSMDI